MPPKTLDGFGGVDPSDLVEVEVVFAKFFNYHFVVDTEWSDVLVVDKLACTEEKWKELVII